MKQMFYVAIAMMLLTTSCTKEDVPLPPPVHPGEITKSPTKEIASFVLRYGSDSAVCLVMDTMIVGNIPTDLDKRDSLVAIYTTTGKTVTVGGKIQKSDSSRNDFTSRVEYVVTAEDGTSKKYGVWISYFNALPVLYLSPAANIGDRETYINTDYILNTQYGTTSGKTTMRGRGNSSWGYALPTGQFRNSFKIKFADKTSLMGMPSDKEWAIISNVYDKSLLRNDAYFWTSDQLRGAEWTPRRKFVDVFMYGEYKGNYLLIETIKASKDRLNIDAKNGDVLTEFNSKPEEGDPRFIIGAGQNFMPVDLKEGTDPEAARLKLQTWYDNIEHYKFGGYDVESFASGFLVNEIFANNDAGFFSSVYVYVSSKTGLITFGPVWDADFSSGNANLTVNSNAQIKPTGFYLAGANIWQFLLNDDAFKASVKSIWDKKKQNIFGIPDHIKAQANTIEMSANATFKKYDILKTPLINSVVVPGTWRGEVDYVCNWLSTRIPWLDTEFNKW